ncbi:MAG: hypothetical protein GY851_13175 [bacterium]|nr:hypothetical protein [bacterium]
MDANGDVHLDGQKVQVGQLTQRAGRFIMRHAKGEIVVRADGRAETVYVVRVREALRLGGVRRIRHEWPTGRAAIFPRTGPQIRAAMAKWTHMFAHPEDYIRPPREQAREAIRAVRREVERLSARRKALDQYVAELLKVSARQDDAQ